MGRGLSAILSPTTAKAVATTTKVDDSSNLKELLVEAIRANPNQPRQQFDETALVALSESLRERGVLQPVLVRELPGGDRYELIAGERRWRAAQLAGLKSVPAIIGTHDDADSLEIALVENMVREDLNPVEEARACSLLVDEFGLTREEVGRRVGRSRVAVSNLLRLLELPESVLRLLESGDLSEGHGRALLLVDDHHNRKQLATQVVAQGWSVRKTEAQARALAGGGKSTDGGPKDETLTDSALREKLAGKFASEQLHAAQDLGERFSRALGVDVSVAPNARGFAFSFKTESWESAVDLLTEVERSKHSERELAPV
jgi:ParB family chromosome partitioning protein